MSVCPVSLRFYVRANMFLSLKHFWWSCPYVSMLVLIYLYAYRFYARVPMFIRFCPYVSMLKIFSMLMFIYFDARAFMFLCFNILYVHAPCFYILVPVCFYTCVRMFLCLCPYISMVVSRCFYAHTRLFQCTYPYISLLEHNLCLCPYVPMLVSLCFYARNIFYAPVPIFLCSHKFSIRKFLENIFTMDLKLCIKISRILWWKPYVSWIFEWSIIEKKLKERWQVGGGRLGNLRLVGWDWLGLPILIGNLELRIVSDVQ